MPLFGGDAIGDYAEGVFGSEVDVTDPSVV